MNNLPTATLSLDLAWIGEGPELGAWFPFDSWCDGSLWKTPAEYVATVWAVADAAWKRLPFDPAAPTEHPRVTCQHRWQDDNPQPAVLYKPHRSHQTCAKCGARQLA